MDSQEINGSRRKTRILVVDDEPYIVKLIHNYLIEPDCEIFTAGNGVEALDQVEKIENLDLIILDIMMPHLTGYEVCRAIREQYSLFELPIMVLTAKSRSSDLVEAFDAGANDYLRKPFEVSELRARTKTLTRLRKLTSANDILQEAIDLKNQFIEMTIHDLKNPLNVVSGMAQLMKMELDSESEHYEYLGLIEDSSSLMLNLVNELLNAARIESGKLTLKKEERSIVQLLEQSIEKNNASAAMKDQMIRFSSDVEATFMVPFDILRMLEVVDNLISNAIKYSPKGKDIEIKVVHQTPTTIRIIVKDNGPGLTEEDKSKIFGKFQRLSAQPTGDETSTGLGLSIVKQLVDLHEGTIWVESTHGNGASFIVELPL
jgi:signal transduction histidine kinase